MTKPGIAIDIPGFGRRDIQIVVSDYTGTHSRGGSVRPGVRKRLRKLAKLMELHIVTADSFGMRYVTFACGFATMEKALTGTY